MKHVLLLLEYSDTEASAGHSVLAVILVWALVFGFSSSGLEGLASSLHMPGVATHMTITVGWKLGSKVPSNRDQLGL